MKTKKQTKDNSAVFLFKVILIAIIGIIALYFLVGWIASLFSVKTEFTIEKETCWNEKIYEIIDIAKVSNGIYHKTLNLEKWDELKCNQDMNSNGYCEQWRLTNKTKEVCKKVEVDEIKFCWYVNEERIDCKILVEKEDLTIDWLQRNCRCIKYCESNICIDKNELEGIYFKNPKNFDKCSEYKCGEYYVEVKE